MVCELNILYRFFFLLGSQSNSIYTPSNYYEVRTCSTLLCFHAYKIKWSDGILFASFSSSILNWWFDRSLLWDTIEWQKASTSVYINTHFGHNLANLLPFQHQNWYVKGVFWSVILLKRKMRTKHLQTIKNSEFL